MRIGIVGAGALGLYYGALLQRGGEDVHFLLRGDYAAISQNGLKIYSINGDFSLPRVEGYLDPGQIGAVDLVLVALKTFANHRFAELVAPLLGEQTLILTLQNGLGNEEALAQLFGPQRVIGGIAFLCSNRGAPGEVHHLNAGRIVLGDYQPSAQPRLEGLVAMFRRAGIDCKATDDLRRTRWEKLVWNIPFNGLSALLLQPVNRLLQPGPCRELVRQLMLEVIAGANAQGLKQPIPETFADAMLAFTDAMGDYRPSMQIDREEGRQLEIASIFDQALAAAQARGVPMPRVEMLATLLKQSSP